MCDRRATGTSAGSITCPFCGSTEVEQVSPFGSQLIVDQWQCGACRSYFEALRESFRDQVPEAGGS